MLKRHLALMATACAVLLAGALPAVAKDCKSEVVEETGEPYASRSLGAFPSSLLAWRKAVQDKYGDGWNTWFRAESRKVDCKETSEGGQQRWVCTRSARPCTLANAKTASSASDTKLTRNLRAGDTGPEVRTLQKLLAEHGHEVSIDGQFGPGTLRAVREFQRQAGLPVDGIVGQGTRDRLSGQ